MNNLYPSASDISISRSKFRPPSTKRSRISSSISKIQLPSDEEIERSMKQVNSINWLQHPQVREALALENYTDSSNRVIVNNDMGITITRADMLRRISSCLNSGWYSQHRPYLNDWTYENTHNKFVNGHKNGIDCSSFVSKLLRDAGCNIKALTYVSTTLDMINFAKKCGFAHRDISKARAGDVIVRRNKSGHVGFIVRDGTNEIIHATGANVHPPRTFPAIKRGKFGMTGTWYIIPIAYIDDVRGSLYD